MKLLLILLSTSLCVESQSKFEGSSEDHFKPRDISENIKTRTSKEVLLEKLDLVRRRRRKILISTEAPTLNLEKRYKVNLDES